MRLWLALFVLIPAWGAPEVDATLWSAGVSAESGWYDFNKDFRRGEQGDDLLCWAVAASNLLAWWQEQNHELLPPGVPVQEQVWMTFCSAFENEGSDPDQGIRWWFNGQYVQRQPGNGQRCASLRDAAAGGYFRVSGPEPEFLLYNGRGAGVTADTLTAVLLSGFRRGDAFWLGASCTRPDGSPFMHSITVWGVDVVRDAAGQTQIAAIYMCDSDDRTRMLHRIPVRREQDKLVFDCAGHPLYGSLGRVTLDTYTGLRCKIEKQ